LKEFSDVLPAANAAARNPSIVAWGLYRTADMLAETARRRMRRGENEPAVPSPSELPA